MKHNFKLSAVSAAIMAVSIASPVFAAEAEKDLSAIEVKKQKQEEVEVIEVTGFKGSLHKAMNNKRFSEGVSDSIYAEDVGKSTDQNIADALSRVTGVTVQEENGEGARISVRGSNADMNQISMNGVALTSNLSSDGENASDANNSVDLGSFSADIISSIDVYKTSAADQDEGSLGASVVLRTVRPLNLNEPRRMFTVEGRYNDYSGESTPRISASFADKYFDEKFGFIATLSAETIHSRQDGVTTDWLDEGLPMGDAGSDDRYQASDIRLTPQLDEDGNQMYDEAGNPIGFHRVIRLRNADGSLPADFDPVTQIAPHKTVVNEETGENGMWLMARDDTAVEANTSERDRLTANVGFQFRPTEDIDIQLDLTHTQTDQTVDNHTMRMNHAPLTVYESDPTLNYVDIQTNTLVASGGIDQTAGTGRLKGTREQTTDVVSLRYEHQLTDDLSMEVLAGYSKSTDETDDYVGMSTATWNTLRSAVLEAQPADKVDTIGYNCVDNCSFFTGTTLAEQDPVSGNWVQATSRAYPLDVRANHLGGLTFIDDEQSDTSKSLFVNFDWIIDNDYLTSIEFGGKYASRNKDVFTMRDRITSELALSDEEDENFSPTAGLGSISVLDMMSGEAFPYDNLAEGLVSDRSNDWYQGWPMMSSAKALQALAGRDPGTIGIKRNLQGTREITTDTLAAYVKFNFEALDGRLTGNLGFRAVQDDTEASGVGGMTFHDKPHIYDPYDLLITRELGDIENPDKGICPEGENRIDPETGDVLHTGYGPSNPEDLENCWDWAVTHAYDYQKDSTTPWTEADGWLLPGGIETNRLVEINYNAEGGPEIIRNDPLGTTIETADGPIDSARLNHRNFQATGEMWQYVDRTTSPFGQNFLSDGVTPVDDTLVFQRTTVATDSASNSVFLPSLNLNYQVMDDQVARFAVSQTMTRPRFDSLNPRAQVTENPWGANATGRAGNTQLKPLTSNNIDFSYEWYFDETGMLSAGLFHKDMKNAEIEVATPYHYQDIRTDYERSNFDDFLMPWSAARMPGEEGRLEGDTENCQPHRFNSSLANSWAVECHVATLRTVQNAGGSSITGMELSYQQNYTMLPGIWSGLGLTTNYTYQNSESDAVSIGEGVPDVATLPNPNTPKHSYNLTVHWEYEGLELRLANRYSGTQLLTNATEPGTVVWLDAANRLDFSSSYEINKNVSLTFQATNLTDEVRRTFSTATNLSDGNPSNVVLDEGNVLDDSGITQSRQTAIYKNGRQFRLGVRASF